MKKIILFTAFVVFLSSPAFAMHPIQQAMMDEMDAKYQKELRRTCERENLSARTRHEIRKDAKAERREKKLVKRSIRREIRDLQKKKDRMFRSLRKVIRQKTREVEEFINNQKKKDSRNLKYAKREDRALKTQEKRDLRKLERIKITSELDRPLSIKEKKEIFPMAHMARYEEPEVFVDYDDSGNLAMVMTFQNGRLINYKEYDADGNLLNIE